MYVAAKPNSKPLKEHLQAHAADCTSGDLAFFFAMRTKDDLIELMFFLRISSLVSTNATWYPD
jgi:hypothetical protein